VCILTSIVGRTADIDPGTVWKTGEEHHVKWDASNPPDQITNPKGKVLLVKNGVQDYSMRPRLYPVFLFSDDILAEHPLAQGFDILKGSVKVTVPKVKPGHNYAVVGECI
jgi:hypothetical protein